MALWDKTQHLPNEALLEIQALYGDRFPIEVRHVLAPWIEDKHWNEIDPENPLHEQTAMNLISSMIQELESMLCTMNSEEAFLMKLKLSDALNKLKVYLKKPLALVKVVQDCLEAELKFVGNAEAIRPGEMEVVIEKQSQTGEKMLKELAALRQQVQENAEILRKMEQEQQYCLLYFHEYGKLGARIQALDSQPDSQQNFELKQKLEGQRQSVQATLGPKASAILEERLSLVSRHQTLTESIAEIQSRILEEELWDWKRRQQLNNGMALAERLDKIQQWCELLGEVIWLTRHQVKEAERLRMHMPINTVNGDQTKDKISSLNSMLTQLLSTLVTSTFIIEQQPPQVMKTNTRFGASVRLLVGGKLNVHMNPPQVKVSIISETQARDLLTGSRDESCGEILNNSGTMEYHQSSKHLSLEFRNMQLRKIRRTEKRGAESVMDEKFAILFRSEFTIGGEELLFKVWIPSLPVVVIVHAYQEPAAYATIFWDNGFAEKNRLPFQVPERVPWCMLADLLSAKFKTCTGRSLEEKHLSYLASKLFRQQLSSYNDLYVPWTNFCKDPLQERSFTFWEWFFHIFRLTKEHLKEPWQNGLIMGFVSRPDAERLLLDSPHGTFLLRFSDSELGGITIAWVARDQVTETQDVFMLKPSSSRDFSIRSLADRLSDLKYLQYMYPDIPKDTAFGQYYSLVSESKAAMSNGYVKPLLVTHVPGWTELSSTEQSSGVSSNSATNPNSPSNNEVKTPSSCFCASNSSGVCASDLDLDIFDDSLVEVDCTEISLEALLQAT